MPSAKAWRSSSGSRSTMCQGRKRRRRPCSLPTRGTTSSARSIYIGDAGIDGEPILIDEVGVEQAWRRYYETLAAAASSGLFDSLAHPDLVRMHGPEIPWDWEAVAGSMDGVCLEVSNAGLHKPHTKLNPNPELLREARARGTAITLASDAHVPENVGRDLDRAVDHAREARYETVTVFDLRQRRQESLG